MEEGEEPFRSADCIISDDELTADCSWEQIDSTAVEPLFGSIPSVEGFDIPEIDDDFQEPYEETELSYAPTSVEPAPVETARVNDSKVDAIAWRQMVASNFGQFGALPSDLSFPWESGVLADIFGKDSAMKLPECVGYGDQHLQPLSNATGSSGSKQDAVELPQGAKYLKAVQSIKDIPYFEGKAQKLELACGLWMDILSIDWTASEVGGYLAPALLRDATGGEAVEILRASFGVKSPSTLLKRAGAFKRYIQWHGKNGFGTVHSCEPLPLQEAAVWEYFLFLRTARIEKRRGYTVPSSFLESVRFAKFTVGLKDTDEVLASRRLLGFSALERRDKGPSCQAPGLEVEHVRRLHEVLNAADNDIDRLGAGCFLICLYSRARWSDVRYIDHVEIHEGRHGTLTLFTLEHKTASVGLRREQYMPLVVPWEGIVNENWIQTFLEVYEKCGLNILKRPLGPLLPAPKATGHFCARPLSTSEAASWLRGLLEGTSNFEFMRSHSLKASLLIWSAKAGFDKETRAVLGHHSSAVQGSDVVYSRHLQVRALRKLSMLLRRVRIGLDVEDDQMREFGVLQTPAMGTPVPCTPGVMKQVDPPGLVVSESGITQPASQALEVAFEEAQQIEELQSVKEEALDLADVESHAGDVSLFPLSVVQHGLVEIESSSGSSSESSSLESSDEEERPPPTFQKPRYSEDVPADRDFYRHFKSGILHSCPVGKSVAACKVAINSNYKLMERVMTVRYAKCIRCFPVNNSRLRSLDDMVGALDSAVKRQRP